MFYSKATHLQQKPWMAAVLKSFSGTLWFSGIVLTVSFLDQATGNRSRLCLPGLLMNCQAERHKEMPEKMKLPLLRVFVLRKSTLAITHHHVTFWFPTGFIFHYFPAYWKMYKSPGPLLLILQHSAFSPLSTSAPKTVLVSSTPHWFFPPWKTDLKTSNLAKFFLNSWFLSRFVH